MDQVAYERAKEAEQKRHEYERAQEGRQIPSKPEPPPPWAACGIEEKLNRLRRSYPHLTETVYRLDADFRDHFHAASEAPALPLRRSGHGILGSAAGAYDPLA